MSFENLCPSPDRSGNPFVRSGGQKIGADSGIKLLIKLQFLKYQIPKTSNSLKNKE
jgi:hypothetical protein